MQSESIPPLMQRIGGPQLLSTALISCASVGIFLSVFVGEPSATADGAIALRWLLVCAATVLGYVAYALSLRRLCRGRFAREGYLPPAVAVAIVLGAVVLIAMLLRLGALVCGLSVTGVPALRVLLTVPFALWFGFGLVLLLDEIARSHGQRQRLLDRRTDVALADLQQDLIIAGLRDVQWREVERQLAAPRRALLERLDDADAGATSEVRALAQGSVREISARLWAKAQREYPRFGITDVVRGIVRTEAFHPWVMAAVIVVGASQSAIDVFGWRDGVLLTVSSAAAAAIVMLLGNAAMRRWPERHAAIFLVVVAVLVLGLAPAYVLRDRLVPGSVSPSWAAAQAVSIIVVVLMISGFGAWVHIGRTLRRSYLSEVDERRMRSILRAQAVTAAARDVAQVLHGTVQTKLIAAAVAGEQAIESGDRGALQRAFDEARSVLEDLGSVERPVGAIADEVLLKVALWEGLCEIRVDLGELGSARADARGVGRVVEEGIANAVRHGGATLVEIAVRAAADGSIEVVVDDDGAGLASTEAGTGSAILDVITGGAWERAPSDHGCRLSARVPALAT